MKVKTFPFPPAPPIPPPDAAEPPVPPRALYVPASYPPFPYAIRTIAPPPPPLPPSCLDGEEAPGAPSIPFALINPATTLDACIYNPFAPYPPFPHAPVTHPPAPPPAPANLLGNPRLNQLIMFALSITEGDEGWFPLPPIAPAVEPPTPPITNVFPPLPPVSPLLAAPPPPPEPPKELDTGAPAAPFPPAPTAAPAPPVSPVNMVPRFKKLPAIHMLNPFVVSCTPESIVMLPLVFTLLLRVVADVYTMFPWQAPPAQLLAHACRANVTFADAITILISNARYNLIHSM